MWQPSFLETPTSGTPELRADRPPSFAMSWQLKVSESILLVQGFCPSYLAASEDRPALHGSWFIRFSKLNRF